MERVQKHKMSMMEEVLDSAPNTRWNNAYTQTTSAILKARSIRRQKVVSHVLAWCRRGDVVIVENIFDIVFHEFECVFDEFAVLFRSLAISYSLSCYWCLPHLFEMVWIDCDCANCHHWFRMNSVYLATHSMCCRSAAEPYQVLIIFFMFDDKISFYWKFICRCRLVFETSILHVTEINRNRNCL